MDAFRHLHTRPLPATEEMHDRLLCIPLFEGLRDAEIDQIAELIVAANS